MWCIDAGVVVLWADNPGYGSVRTRIVESSVLFVSGRGGGNVGATNVEVLVRRSRQSRDSTSRQLCTQVRRQLVAARHLRSELVKKKPMETAWMRVFCLDLMMTILKAR